MSPTSPAGSDRPWASTTSILLASAKMCRPACSLHSPAIHSASEPRYSSYTGAPITDSRRRRADGGSGARGGRDRGGGRNGQSLGVEEVGELQHGAHVALDEGGSCPHDRAMESPHRIGVDEAGVEVDLLRRPPFQAVAHGLEAAEPPPPEPGQVVPRLHPPPAVHPPGERERRDARVVCGAKRHAGAATGECLAGESFAVRGPQFGVVLLHLGALGDRDALPFRRILEPRDVDAVLVEQASVEGGRVRCEPGDGGGPPGLQLRQRVGAQMLIAQEFGQVLARRPSHGAGLDGEGPLLQPHAAGSGSVGVWALGRNLICRGIRGRSPPSPVLVVRVPDRRRPSCRDRGSPFGARAPDGASNP